MRFKHLQRSAMFLWLAIIGLNGCAAYSYTDKDGTQHVIGVVDLAIKPAGKNETLAGNVVSIQTIGVLAARRDGDLTFALGYADETTAAIRDNALVLGDPNQAVRKIFGPKEGIDK